MLKSNISYKEAFVNLGVRNILASFTVIILIVLTLSIACSAFYKTVQERTRLYGMLVARQSTDNFNRYFVVRTNSLLVSVNALNKMLKDGESIENIKSFIKKGSMGVKETIDSEYTGIYAYINGQYIDGEGWIPPAGYAPEERNWYQTVMQEPDKKICFMSPHRDLKHDRMVVTIAMRLDDKKSVIATDINLDVLEELVRHIGTEIRGSYGMILSGSGEVIAHPDESKIGKVIYEDRYSFDAHIAHKVNREGLPAFETEFEQESYLVLADNMVVGLKGVVVIPTITFYAHMNTIIQLSIALILITIVGLLLIFTRLSFRNLEIQNKNVQLNCIANFYESIHDINLETDTFIEVNCKTNVSKAVGGTAGKAQQTLYSAMRTLTDPSSLPSILKFVNLGTLEARINKNGSVTEEFLNNQKQWCRGRFTEAKRTPSGKLQRVLWMVELIDDEKKHREELIHLSQTDLMTSLYNRTAGESKIQSKLHHGTGGMFILLDADKFKSINDNFGHAVGDKVIVSLAGCLSHAFRNRDIVFRLGGDEFAAYAVGILNEDDGKKILNRLFQRIQRISLPEIGDHKICVSVGAALTGNGVMPEFEELYKQADLAAYESKKIQGNSYTFYTDVKKGPQD